MGVLLTILVIVVILAAVFWLLGMVPLDGKARQIVNVILAVIGIVLLLGVLFGRVPLIAW